MYRSVKREIYQLKDELGKVIPSYIRVIDALQDYIWHRHLDELLEKVQEITLSVYAVEFDPDFRDRFIQSLDRFKDFEYMSEPDLNKVKKEYEDQLQEYKDALGCFV